MVSEDIAPPGALTAVAAAADRTQICRPITSASNDRLHVVDLVCDRAADMASAAVVGDTSGELLTCAVAFCVAEDALALTSLNYVVVGPTQVLGVVPPAATLDQTHRTSDRGTTARKRISVAEHPEVVALAKLVNAIPDRPLAAINPTRTVRLCHHRGRIASAPVGLESPQVHRAKPARPLAFLAAFNQAGLRLQVRERRKRVTSALPPVVMGGAPAASRPRLSRVASAAVNDADLHAAPTLIEIPGWAGVMYRSCACRYRVVASADLNAANSRAPASTGIRA